ncbi:MAG TPA: ribokinase [Candidatus Obscuribacterales bacterium]
MGGHVVVVGSLSVDFVMRVPRRPQKGETIAGSDFNTFVGGKGNNQALAAARAGAKVHMVGRVGTDSYGDRLIETLTRDGIDPQFIFRDKEVGTGIANIYVDPEGDNSIVIVPQSNARLSRQDVEKAQDIILDAKVVLLQMEIPDDAILAAAELGQKANAIVILNPAPAPPSGRLPKGLLSYIDLVVPNQTEIALLTGIAADTRESAKEAAVLLQQQGVAQVIVTLGEQGALFINADGKDKMIPSYKVKAVDSTAAGDAFCGALAAALASGKPIEDAISVGCAAGALAVTRAGAEPSLPTASEIEMLMSVSA